MNYPFNMWVRVGDKGEEVFVSSVQDAGDLYKRLESLRFSASLEHQYRGNGHIEFTLYACRPATLKLSNMEKSMYYNGYTLRTLEHFFEDALVSNALFYPTSPEPSPAYRTATWEDLL